MNRLELSEPGRASSDRYKRIAADADALDLLAAFEIDHVAIGLLVRDQGRDVEATGIVDRARDIGCRHDRCAFLGEEIRRVLADRPEALHGNAHAREFHADLFLRDIGTDHEAECGGADFVQRYAAEFPRQAGTPAALVLYECHGGFVRPHVGTRYVVGDAPDALCEGTDPLLLEIRVHQRVAEDNRFRAAVRQARSGVLQRHGASETPGPPGPGALPRRAGPVRPSSLRQPRPRSDVRTTRGCCRRTLRGPDLRWPDRTAS